MLPWAEEELQTAVKWFVGSSSENVPLQSVAAGGHECISMLLGILYSLWGNKHLWPEDAI